MPNLRSTFKSTTLPVVPAASCEPQRPRLLLFANSIGLGGMEAHVKLLARHLDRQRFEVFSICPAGDQTQAFAEAVAAVTEHTAKITPDRRNGFWRQLVETVRFYRQVKAWHITHLHMHSTTYRGQVWAFLAARLAGVQKIFVTEHLAPENPLPFYERWLRNVFSYAVDGIVCVSHKNYQARLAYLYTPPEHTIVVDNGVDLEDFKPIAPQVLAALRQAYDIPTTAQVVGTVVRFEPEKGLEYLIEAAPQIVAACPDVLFLMVGDGSLRAQLEAQVGANGVSEHFRFVGFQSDPRPFLALIKIFVLPVPVGSMSIGLLEAMAMGCAPVITFGGAGEAVIDGENGFAVEPRNPLLLAQAVARLLQEPALAIRFSKAARQRIETAFSAERVARQLEKFYQR